VFLQNKYSDWYFNIINKAMTLKRDCYVEKRHIRPVNLGGSSDISNLVELTAGEHFICHWLLVKMTQSHDKIKMARALHLMMYMKSKGQNREQHARLVRGKKFAGQALANIRAGYTAERNAKISAAQKGREFPGDLAKLLHLLELL
jgi:hypothetical protein